MKMISLNFPRKLKKKTLLKYLRYWKLIKKYVYVVIKLNDWMK